MPAEYLAQLRGLSRNARLYLISNVLQAVSAGALTVLYTLYLAALGYDARFIGLVVLVGTIGGGIGIVPAGPLVDRFGWRAMLVFSDIIGAVALLVQLVYPRREVILVTTVGVGISLAIVLVVNSPLLAATSGPRDRTFLFGLNTALTLLVTVAGELLAGFLPGWFRSPGVAGSGLLQALSPWLVPGAQARAYELALLVTGATALPSIIPVLLLRQPPPAARPTVAGDAAGAPNGTSAPAPPASAWSARTRSARAWSFVGEARTIARGAIGRFSLSQALIGLGAGLFAPFVSLYFVNQLHASVGYFSVVSSAATVLIAGGALVIVPVANRLGKVRTSVVAQLASLPPLVALGLAPTLPVAATGYLVHAPLMNAPTPPLQAFLMEHSPEERRGLASGVYNVSWQVANAIGAAIGGILFDQVSHGSVFLVAAALYSISILLLALWFGRVESTAHPLAAKRAPLDDHAPPPGDPPADG